MRNGADIIHLKLLNKIRNQDLASTSKKQVSNEPQSLNQGKKTPLRSKIGSNLLNYVSPGKNDLQLGVLKSYVIRQDYFQCVIELLQPSSHQRPQKMKAMVSREQNLVIRVGQVYQIQQQQSVQLGVGTSFIFARLSQWQYKP